tara:strand:+ start:1454 stop:1846 length:393 start_codon:yes stop_codon:yes gene_type:complete
MTIKKSPNYYHKWVLHATPDDCVEHFQTIIQPLIDQGKYSLIRTRRKPYNNDMNSYIYEYTWDLKPLVISEVTEQTKANIKECLSNEIFNKAIKDTDYLDEIINEYIWLREQSEGLNLMVKQHLEKEDSM